MNKLINKIKSKISNKRAEGYINSGIKILIAVVVGAVLLGGLIYLIKGNILANSEQKILDMIYPDKTDEFLGKVKLINNSKWNDLHKIDSEYIKQEGLEIEWTAPNNNNIEIIDTGLILIKTDIKNPVNSEFNLDTPNIYILNKNITDSGGNENVQIKRVGGFDNIKENGFYNCKAFVVYKSSNGKIRKIYSDEVRQKIFYDENKNTSNKLIPKELKVRRDYYRLTFYADRETNTLLSADLSVPYVDYDSNILDCSGGWEIRIYKCNDVLQTPYDLIKYKEMGNEQVLYDAIIDYACGGFQDSSCSLSNLEAFDEKSEYIISANIDYSTHNFLTNEDNSGNIELMPDDFAIWSYDDIMDWDFSN